jgi:polar amino acid transport system permease protein
LLAIPKTQIEAGLALGLSRLQVMRYVVIVPALRVIYPALTGQLTLTLLGTSIASAISATELTLAGAKIESQTFRSLETFLVLAAIYISITFAFRLLYWIVGLWLFRRSVPKTGSAAATLSLPREAET